MNRRNIPAVLLALAAAGLVIWAILILCGIVGGNPAMAAESRVQRALAAMRQRDYAAAAAEWEKAADGNIDLTLSLGGLAECQFYLGQYDAALATCAKLAGSVPNCGRAAHIQGLVALKQGREEEARVHFRRAAGWGEPAALLHLRRAG